MNKRGLGRRTLKLLDYYPTPQELYNKIVKSSGWPYKTQKLFYLSRDRALCSLLYLLGLRVSEALRLERSQFVKMEDHVLVRAIKLSKRKEGKEAYRQEGFLDLKGERKELSFLVVDYLDLLKKKEKDKLFSFGTCRAFQIVSLMLGIPCHWLRAYCENYLYDVWEKDMIAVADYLKIHPRTLPLYIRKSYTKYKAR